MNDPWHKSQGKQTETVLISRDSSPVIAPNTFQEMKLHEDREIWEAAYQK